MPVRERGRQSNAVDACTDVHLYQQPTEELLLQLVGKEMYSKWKFFGVYLGVKHNVRDGIKQQMQGDPEECFIRLCNRWLSRASGTGEKPRTWKTVLNAVRECEYSQVADSAERTLMLRLTKADVAVRCLDKYKDQLDSLCLTKKAKQLGNLYLLSPFTSLVFSFFTFCVPSSVSSFHPDIVNLLKEAMQRDHENMEVLCTFLRLEYSGNATALKISSDMKDDFDRGTLSLECHVTNFNDNNRNNVASDNERYLMTQSRDKGYSASCFSSSWIMSGAIILIVLLAAVIVLFLMQGSIQDENPVSSLPSVPTAFTGRSEEVKDVLSAFQLEQIRIVAITGGPGYGKSSLAIVCAHELARKRFHVHHILLNEVNTTARFTSKVLMAVDELHRDEQLEDALLMRIKALKETTVLVLDNADHLTLNKTTTMSDFLDLLKKMASISSLLKMIVTTRYRLNMIDGFKQIHLQPLSHDFTVDLLRSLLPSTSGGGAESSQSSTTHSSHIQQIANLTGGIPLAAKVVCQLLNSQLVSMAEVVEGLSIRPVHTLSHETFSAEERLNKCFNLSYTYLSKPAKLCFVWASRFPDSFTVEAGQAIVGKLTKEPDCLSHLVYRSLLEHDVRTNRYSMHLLLQHFVQEQEFLSKDSGQRMKFRTLYIHYYMRHLLRLSENSSKRVLDAFSSTIDLEYEHFLHSLVLLSQQKVNTDTEALLPINLQLEIAEKTFFLAQIAFPSSVLIEWWQWILIQFCIVKHTHHSMSKDDPIFTLFVSFVRKLGSFWLYGQQNTVMSQKVYKFAFASIEGEKQIGPQMSCERMSEPEYVLFLQDFAKFNETLQDLKMAQAIYDFIDVCGCTIQQEKNPSLKVIDILPKDKWCSNGLTVATESFHKSKRYSFIPTLDYLYLVSLCTSSDDAMQKLLALEAGLLASGFTNVLTHSQAMLSMSKLWDQLHGNVSRDVYWLEKAASVLEGDIYSVLNSLTDEIRFQIHFRLARLYFTKLDNISKALFHSQLAYGLASSTIFRQGELFKSAFRLGGLLFANESFSTSVVYVQKAAKILPLLHDSIQIRTYYSLQTELNNRLLRLALLGIKLERGQDYYQWYKTEVSSLVMILSFEFTKRFASSETALALSDAAYSKVNAASNILRIAQTFQLQIHLYWLYIWSIFVYVFSVAALVAICICNHMCLSLLFACCSSSCPKCLYLFHSVALLHFSFHYFLYCAIYKGQLWLPTRVPDIYRELIPVYLRTTSFIFWCFCFAGLLLVILGTALNYDVAVVLSNPKHSLSLDGTILDEITLYLK